jgi:hypothetical protein
MDCVQKSEVSICCSNNSIGKSCTYPPQNSHTVRPIAIYQHTSIVTACTTLVTGPTNYYKLHCITFS